AQGTVGRLEIDTDGGGDAFTALGIIRGGRNLDIQQMFLDGNAVVTSSGPPPDTGDDDGNLSLSAPDLEIDAGEVGAVGFTLSGLDADATA
ncbi:hypothetical protein MWU52_17905, partial [Jannaschia sp. S6380]|uniref:hypothetical protein n=1 Tax=Jannaschia sp. S6380 TaxID=2926408 RepID=UPI001FF41FE7